LKCRLSPFFVTVPVPGCNEATFAPISPTLLHSIRITLLFPPIRHDHLRPFALISPGLREPDKPRFVRAHRTDRPANRPEFFAPRPLLKLARTMAQRKLSQSRRSSHGPVICRRSWSWKVRSDRRCAEQYRAHLQRSCMP
jgi:hypothetical protein